MPTKHKNIKQISLETGKVVDVFPDITSIMKRLNISYNNGILSCLNGKTKSAFGYYWTTKDEFIIPRGKNCRKICQYSADGIFIEEYPSIKYADKKSGIPFRVIWECCVGKRKTAGNYIWKYK